MKRRLRIIAHLVLMVSLGACGSGGAAGARASSPFDAGAFIPSASKVSTLAATSAAGIDINAGGGATGSWRADQDYSGGQTYTVAQPIVTSGVSRPAPQSVYQTVRYASNLTYKVPNLSTSRSYVVRLHFAETYFTAARQRIFDIAINGAQLVTNFDIFAAAGGADIAVVKSFPIWADSSGTITIQMTATANNAAIAGIEIIPASSAPTPVPSAAPTAAPPTGSGMVMSGVVPTSLSAWDAWLGKKVNVVGAYNDVGASSWGALNDIVWESSQLAGSGLVWSLATYPSSSNLSAVAGGAGNVNYAAWAIELLTQTTPAPDGNYYIRPNWEVPDRWSSWGNGCAASPSNCIAAFRQIASVFHGTSSKFKLVWDTIPTYVNGSIVTTDNAIYYPGDAYVDVLSQDVYLDTSGSVSPAAMWKYALTRANGLNWLTKFAAAHKKRIAVSEWGIDSNDAGPFVVDFENWLTANHAVYQIYFDRGSTQLSNGHFPAAGAVVRQYL